VVQGLHEEPIPSSPTPCSISNSIPLAILALNVVFYLFQADKGHSIMGNIMEKNIYNM
jgi:hypothetical protein